MYIPDPIELMESRQERLIDQWEEANRGVPAGSFRCPYCSHVFAGEPIQISADPDSQFHAEVIRLNRIVGSVVRNLVHLRHDTERPGPLDGAVWARVSHVCGLGSRSSYELCREFGIDPEGK